MNILIGANGSGKTNLISVLNFLKNCVMLVDSRYGITAYSYAVINQLGSSKLLDGCFAYPANASYVFEFSKNNIDYEWGRLELTLLVKDAISLPFIRVISSPRT